MMQSIMSSYIDVTLGCNNQEAEKANLWKLQISNRVVLMNVLQLGTYFIMSACISEGACHQEALKENCDSNASIQDAENSCPFV